MNPVEEKDRDLDCASQRVISNLWESGTPPLPCSFADGTKGFEPVLPP